MDGPVDERELVDRARAGDVIAQGEIFDHYWPKMVRYAYAHCHNQHDAEDLASEVFLRMVEAIGRFRWQENVPFAAWLFRIARNETANHFRRASPTVSLFDEEIGELAEPGVPEEIAERHATLDKIFSLAERLPKLQQEVIRLRFAADLSLADTARILARSENNVKVHQHRAISRIRELLDAEQRRAARNG